MISVHMSPSSSYRIHRPTTNEGQVGGGRQRKRGIEGEAGRETEREREGEGRKEGREGGREGGRTIPPQPSLHNADTHRPSLPEYPPPPSDPPTPRPPRCFCHVCYTCKHSNMFPHPPGLCYLPRLPPGYMNSMAQNLGAPNTRPWREYLLCISSLHVFFLAILQEWRMF